MGVWYVAACVCSMVCVVCGCDSSLISLTPQVCHPTVLHTPLCTPQEFFYEVWCILILNLVIRNFSEGIQIAKLLPPALTEWKMHSFLQLIIVFPTLDTVSYTDTLTDED